jgi:predicted phage terminase large subunit-like protein
VESKFNLFSSVADSLEHNQNDPRVKWHESARADQRQPAGKWDTWLVRGGRGSGKTHTGANTMVEWILDDRDSMTYESGSWGIVGPTFQAAWTVCVEGESGLLAAFGTNMSEVRTGKSQYVSHAWRSHGEIRLRNGDTIYVDSANDGADRVQGKNLKGVWCDELGMWAKWEQAWDESIKYACRKAGSKIIATTTPKVSRPAAKLIRRLLQDPLVPVAKLRTIDNSDNLSESFIESVVGRAKGTRLEKQELEGELLDDISGALWSWPLLDSTSVHILPEGVKLTTTYVGVDPSDGKESGDEQAYTVVGIGSDKHLYVVESWGDRISPNAFLRKAVDAAVRWDATLVVEKNHGQGYLDLSLQQVQKDMGTSQSVRLVSAGKGKKTRAEPVAALYERKFVHHVKGTRRTDDGDYVETEQFSELEDQMCSFTGAADEKSPDRLDSLVWAIFPFLNYTFGNTSKHTTRVRKWAGNVPEPRPLEKPLTSRRSHSTRPEPEREGPWESPEIVQPDRPHTRHWDTGADF